MKEFIDKWQTLIGSALGPFLAVILSAIGFWIKSAIESKSERKEFLRRIEISMARGLNDTFAVREQLKHFSQRIKNLATEARKITDKTFFFGQINFPTIREVHRDTDTLNFKIKSYYLHNKLMWIETGIKEMNKTILNLKNDFEGLIRKNELLVAIIGNNPNPQKQREAYIENLERFAKATDDYVENIKQGIEIMTQVKIYNEKIRRRYGYWFLWRQEGTKLKYFRDKKAQKAFSRNLESLDHIDEAIKKEVEIAIKDAEARSAKLSENQA